MINDHGYNSEQKTVIISWTIMQHDQNMTVLKLDKNFQTFSQLQID